MKDVMRSGRVSDPKITHSFQKPVPNLKAVHVCTAKEPALGQENWFSSGINKLLVQEILTLVSWGWIIMTKN